MESSPLWRVRINSIVIEPPMIFLSFRVCNQRLDAGFGETTLRNPTASGALRLERLRNGENQFVTIEPRCLVRQARLPTARTSLQSPFPLVSLIGLAVRTS